MAIAIRDVRENELDSVLALNNAAGATILPLDAGRMRDFFHEAAYFRVAEADGHLAGFLIALREDARYGSANFLWFHERYPEFLYIDRIVVAQRYRGIGLGRVFYADVTSFAEVRVSLLGKELCSHPFVRTTYGDAGLPVQPWLAERPRLVPPPQTRAAGAH